MLCMFCVSSLAKPDWRERAKKYSVYPILSIIFVLISVIFIAVACVFYEIPEQDFSYLEKQTEAGLYLFVIGNVIFSVAFLIFSLALKNLAAGKISMEDITLFKEKSAKETRQTENALLSDKLKELHDLRNSGLITEQEFDDKKEELLKNYKYRTENKKAVRFQRTAFLLKLKHDEQESRQNADKERECGELALPHKNGLGKKLAEYDVEHCAARKSQRQNEHNIADSAERIPDQSAEHRRRAAQGGEGDCPALFHSARDERNGDRHALRYIVKSDDDCHDKTGRGKQRLHQIIFRGVRCTDHHAFGQVMERNRRHHDQTGDKQL